MRIEPGMAVVIGAVLIFYLRLIILQRERVKQVRRAEAARVNVKQGKAKNTPPEPAPGFSVFSPVRRDQVIGAFGLALMVLGLLLNAGRLPFPTFQPYWWLPTSLGIVLFSFAFKL